MNIVINRCFGGYSVSRKALLWLREKGYEPALWPNEVTEGERYENGKLNTDDYNSFSLELGERCDDLLVECVKTLKKESFGQFARLKIVKIPDGVDWAISEYDGLETVEEVHRSWS